VSAPGAANLQCKVKVPNGPGFIADGSTYTDMYNAANKSGNVSET
jgi:hypothetical protein